MNIDQWAAQASTDLTAEGETEEEYEARIARLRALSAENAAKHEWSHRRFRTTTDTREGTSGTRGA